jgi:hypothetical protein
MNNAGYAVRQENEAKGLVQETLLKAFRELRGGQVELTPSHTTRKDSRPLMTIPLWQDRIVT